MEISARSLAMSACTLSGAGTAASTAAPASATTSSFFPSNSLILPMPSSTSISPTKTFFKIDMAAFSKAAAISALGSAAGASTGTSAIGMPSCSRNRFKAAARLLVAW